MYCIECGQILPAILTPSTSCTKCKTPVSTWWDESSKTFRTNRESILPYPPPSKSSSFDTGMSRASPFYVEEGERARMASRRNKGSEEERVFNCALVVMEMHFQRPGTYMRDTMAEAKKMLAKTLDASLNKAEVRYAPLLLVPYPDLQLTDNAQRNTSKKRRRLETPRKHFPSCHHPSRIPLPATCTRRRRICQRCL